MVIRPVYIIITSNYYNNIKTMLSRRAVSIVSRFNRAGALRMYTEGSTGAPRSDGSSDAFTVS